MFEKFTALFSSAKVDNTKVDKKILYVRSEACPPGANLDEWLKKLRDGVVEAVEETTAWKVIQISCRSTGQVFLAVEGRGLELSGGLEQRLTGRLGAHNVAWSTDKRGLRGKERRGVQTIVEEEKKDEKLVQRKVATVFLGPTQEGYFLWRKLPGKAVMDTKEVKSKVTVWAGGDGILFVSGREFETVKDADRSLKGYWVDALVPQALVPSLKATMADLETWPLWVAKFAETATSAEGVVSLQII
uniref:Uncharacterized protein n=1 Tax=Chromera velia CCMP2878 TaxID=1169474 RepID=A0A0G4HUG8_9ALVE|eukprot:Cvel_8655.t1-p1 / transcript=Cvel_8655.t1 / gene=Cvel_8655 / organism=Chromera_velia_CCMP2878 / gene_product=hypothetical protein / transcript_product=hypothetical protein / location=Cvel_scaffold482:60509-65598(-) / protein_length=244 / sequence_SO=supercontig / SO=protein_coding / is_pseudo=false